MTNGFLEQVYASPLGSYVVLGSCSTTGTRHVNDTVVGDHSKYRDEGSCLTLISSLGLGAVARLVEESR